MPKRDWKLITKEVINDLYFGRGWTQRQIAEHFGFKSPMPVQNAFYRLGIAARPGGKSLKGINNPAWKGDNASYTALHNRVARLRGKPSHCEECGHTGSGRKYEWANVSGQYTNPNDYVRLCTRCHRKKDHNHLNLRGVKRTNHRKLIDGRARGTSV